MARESFRTQIARNKRNSLVLIICFLIVFVALGYVVGYVWGQGSAVFSMSVAAIAALIAFAMALGSYFGGASAVLHMSRARQITHADDPQLFNVVEEMCLAGGLPLPKIYIFDDSALNAFATGRNPDNAAVAITRGLREKLTRDELQGVMAHELSHIRHYDILYATMLAVMVGTMVMLSEIFLRSLFYGAGSRRRRSNNNDSGGGQIVMLVIAIVLAILAPILAKIIQMAMSRQREYLADAGSVELTRNPEGIASALSKLSHDQEMLEVANSATAPMYIVQPIKKLANRSRGLFETHPPTADRIARILQTK